MIILTDIDISVAGDDGGTKFVLTGTFPTGTSIYIYVGPLGSTADPKAHSGKPGRAVTSTGTTATAYLPKLAPGTYNVYVTDGVDNDTLAAAISILRSNYKSGIYGMRAAYSPIFAVGARSVDREAP